jgi:amino acid adenylation domain-containing protein
MDARNRMQTIEQLPERSQASVQFLSTLERFAQQVARTPDAAAVFHEQRLLTYRQLDHLADRFATALAEQGVAFGQSVGLCIDRCPEAIAAMLGAFKLGAVFVPLDPEYPLERIRFMIEDAGITVVITHDAIHNPLAQLLRHESTLTWIDSNEPSFQQLPFQCHSSSVRANDLAYIMYTSGSTGKPKGVQIEHLALLTYCLADIEIYQLLPADRTLQFSTLNFDIAIEEIFPPLLSGGSVVVRPRQRAADANELSGIVNDHAVTALHLATAYWHEWVDLMKATGDRVPRSLRMVLATGEKVSVEHYRRWLALCDHPVLWCNAYGPTECTVTSTVFIPDEQFDADIMPIGKPLPGYQAHILDEAFHVLGVHETGLLFISGPALARGYLNRPDLTEKAFVTVDLPGEGPVRLYRTGDLARWLPDGNIEFAGRVDHQIKLGSYRIEPGEIESVLSKHPNVRDSIVLHEQVAGQKHLIAYVACDVSPPSIDELAGYLRQHLPAYMVPVRYLLLETLPKTINGKIDRNALPSPELSKTIASDRCVPPRDAMEEQLCQLWCEVLRLPQVGIHDDFFALGGSSLLVTRVVAELTRTLGIQLPVRDFFANPTVATAARHLRGLTGQGLKEGTAQWELDLAAVRDSLPRIQAGFISAGQHLLFSVHYLPPAQVIERQHAVLLCHPYGHEYVRAYRNSQQLAIQLACAGFHVLRFDYHGTGNSSGASSHCRIESFQSDIRHAASELRLASRCERLSLVGIRLGATLAAGSQLHDLTSLVLWDPVASGATMLEQYQTLHRYALSSQTRYSRIVRTAGESQLFGTAGCREKWANLAQLTLPKPGDAEHLVVLSRGYSESEAGIRDALTDWNTISVDDDIHWHRPEFTESAFSAPEAARKIMAFLQGANWK